MKEDHEGMYQCMAENGDSSAQAPAQVTLGGLSLSLCLVRLSGWLSFCLSVLVPRNASE